MRKDFVASGFLVSKEKVLLVKHRKLGLWLPVGGHIESDETPEEALRREAMEEAGLEIERRASGMHSLRTSKHVEGL